MISRQIWLNILIRVILILIFSFLLALSVLSSGSLKLIALCLAGMLLTASSLVWYLNSVNRKIKLFFDSVNNDDTSLYFSEGAGSHSLRELSASIDKVNTRIRKLRREAEEKDLYMSMLLEHLATGIITYNEKGFIIHANAAAKKLLALDVLTHLRQIEKTDRNLYTIINSIKPFERKVAEVNTSSGTVDLALKAASFSLGGSELVILSIQDIRHELDEHEVESWMKLIRVLMHEIMNSVTPVASLSESLSRMLRKGSETVKPSDVTPAMIDTLVQGLNVISDQGRGLMSFVESYRKLSRLPEPEKTEFSVNSLFSRAKVLFDSLGTEGICLAINQPANDVILYADQNLICQVLLNLFRNAAEACEGKADAKITLSASVGSDGRAEICVADNGPGIPEELADQVFVPFFTTKSKGTGIGLSISRQIMKIHGGFLKVRSHPGKETVFCLGF